MALLLRLLLRQMCWRIIDIHYTIPSNIIVFDYTRMLDAQLLHLTNHRLVLEFHLNIDDRCKSIKTPIDMYQF